MITEDYVSFETAKLLKEKGFKEWCYKCYSTAVYHKGIPISFDEECELKDEGLDHEIEYVEGGHLYDFGCDNSEKETKVWAAPTLWVVMKWLRKIYNIGIFPSIYGIAGRDGTIESYPYGTDIVNLQTHELICGDILPKDTYEEACEVAIKYCLENLI